MELTRDLVGDAFEYSLIGQLVWNCVLACSFAIADKASVFAKLKGADSANSPLKCVVRFRRLIHAAIATLKPRQQVILKLHYGFGDSAHALQHVADQLGIAREHVRQIQSKAEERLASCLRADGFEPIPPRRGKANEDAPQSAEVI